MRSKKSTSPAPPVRPAAKPTAKQAKRAPTARQAKRAPDAGGATTAKPKKPSLTARPKAGPSPAPGADSKRLQDELRKTRQELAEARRRYAELYDRTPNGYVTLDEKGVIREINLPGAQLLGKERSSLLGKPFAAFVAKGESRQFSEHLRRCQAGAAQVTTELTIKGARARTVQLLSIPAQVEARQGAFFRTALLDLSERRQAQALLQQSLAQQQALLHALPDMMFRLSKDGTYLDFHAEKTGELLVPPAQIIGSNIRQTMPPPVLEQCLRALQVVQETGQLQTLEYRLEQHGGLHDYEARLTLGSNDDVIVIVRNITARKQAEAAVRASEARFAGILNSAMDAIITMDAEQHIILFNAAAEEMFGCTAAAALGQRIEKFIPARYRQTHPQRVNDFSKTELSKRRMGEHGGIHGLRANGEEFPVESSISQVEIGGQKFFTVIHRDISQRLQRTADLRKSEALLAATQSLVHLGSYDYKIEPPEEVYWSDETYRILGLDPAHPAPTREEYLQHIVHAADQQRVRALLEETLNSAAPFSCEYRVVKPDGTVSEVVSVAEPVLDADGKVLRLVGTVMDISARKHAERRLIEQAAMLNQAQEAIMVRDLDGGIRFWNQGAERLYGWQEVEVIGRPVRQLLNRGDSAQLDAAIKTVIEKGDWAGELRQVTKDGRELIVEAHWTLIRDAYGQPQSILAINNDITEKKKLEAQFLRAQRLESLGTLAGGIAHDLNNILSPVLMGVQMLQMKLTDADNQRWLEVMRGNVERGADMVKQILLFARGVQGERVPLQIKHLVKELIKLLDETFPKAIEVKFALPEELALIAGDATQLQQVLMNLCVNARDAMPNGGKLVIEATNLHLEQEYAALAPEAQAGQYVCISISDTGPGIPEALKDKIFDPFFTTKELGQGTGLGLSTALGIVKSHHGFINVHSEAGRGAKFTVFLPAYAAGQTAQATLKRPEMPAGHGELILVIDDEAAVREITRTTLETFGYRVLTARDGTEALTVYAQHHNEIQAVLTDMMMPNMDGPSAIRALRKLNPQLKVIASSGLTEQEKINEMAALGVKHFLLKPYTADRLLRELAEVLRTV